MRKAIALLFVVPLSLAAQDVHARLDSAMRVAERDGFSGVVRVEQGGSVVLERGYGLANRAKQSPFTPATVVQIGSNTKDFTAVAILQLVQAGRIALADPISKYFPAAPADKKDITIDQLMTHRAGFPLGIGPDFEVLGRQALVDSAMRTRLLFPPGARQSYSNTGFSLLAAIIEQVTHESYDAYVQEHILDVVGLTHTGFLLPHFPEAALAHGYLVDGSDAGTMLEKPHATDGPYWNLRGNGGMLSTVDDMHAFYAALFGSERLLSAPVRALRFNVDEPIGLAGSDGVNFFLYERLPRAHIEIIIASTSQGAKAPQIRRALGHVLGLPDPDGAGEPMAARPGGKPAPEPIARVVRDFVAVLNAGKASELRGFISEHFAQDPGAPPLDDRVTRLSRMHDSLGEVTLRSVEVFPDGSIEARAETAQHTVCVISVNVDGQSPWHIHSLQFRLGG